MLMNSFLSTNSEFFFYKKVLKLFREFCILQEPGIQAHGVFKQRVPKKNVAARLVSNLKNKSRPTLIF